MTELERRHQARVDATLWTAALLILGALFAFGLVFLV